MNNLEQAIQIKIELIVFGFLHTFVCMSSDDRCFCNKLNGYLNCRAQNIVIF